MTDTSILSRDLVTIVIVNYETSPFVARCVESLKSQQQPHEIKIVDNPSPADDWKNLPTEGVQVIRNSDNVGYGMACNEGAGEASEDSQFICILNPDTAIPPGLLEKWVEAYKAVAPEGGIAAPALLNDNGMVQKSSYQFTTFWTYWANHSVFAGFMKGLRKGSLIRDTWKAPVDNAAADIAVQQFNHAGGSPREMDWLMGAALLMDRTTWQLLQGFSPRYFLYAEDADLCWRCHEASLPVVYYPALAIIHSQGDPTPESRDKSMVRLFDGLMRFVHYNYGPLQRQGVRMAVILDMIARMSLFTVMRVVRPADKLSAPRVRGAWKVLKNWLVFRPSED